MITTPQGRAWLRRGLVLALAVALPVVLVWWLGRPKPVAVTVAVVGLGRVESTVANTRAGSVEACQRTRMSTIAGGRIEEIPVKEGERVRKGQVLMRLWNADQKAQIDLADAQLDTARKHVAETCSMADNAQRDLQRQADLNERGFVSDAALDGARAQAESRRASCASAQSDVAQSQARIRAARVELDRTVLVAPFDGTVAKIVGERGEYSTPSPPGIADAAGNRPDR